MGFEGKFWAWLTLIIVLPSCTLQVTKFGLTLRLCHQHTCIELPFLIADLISGTKRAGPIVSCLCVTLQLQITAAYLMEQPGLLQTALRQRYLYFPAKHTKLSLTTVRWPWMCDLYTFCNTEIIKTEDSRVYGLLKFANACVHPANVVQSPGLTFH